MQCRVVQMQCVVCTTAAAVWEVAGWAWVMAGWCEVRCRAVQMQDVVCTTAAAVWEVAGWYGLWRILKGGRGRWSRALRWGGQQCLKGGSVEVCVCVFLAHLAVEDGLPPAAEGLPQSALQDL